MADTRMGDVGARDIRVEDASAGEFSTEDVRFARATSVDLWAQSTPSRVASAWGAPEETDTRGGRRRRSACERDGGVARETSTQGVLAHQTRAQKTWPGRYPRGDGNRRPPMRRWPHGAPCLSLGRSRVRSAGRGSGPPSSADFFFSLANFCLDGLILSAMSFWKAGLVSFSTCNDSMILRNIFEHF